ncbi:tRNA guanosine(34) transglycosylase Tgt [Patescibacteria group bacterium]|nr:tRNA guanosine(34) transglycosylase Tgt [Patescibacteria group bacterium]
MQFSFEIIKNDERSKARVGIIKTAHGNIETPAFVPVGTQATVKSMDNFELEEIGVQLFFINTYHLYLRPGLGVIKEFGGLHEFTNWKRPLMTDSGGFQVFSLGRNNTKKRLGLIHEEVEPPLIKITEDGVYFRSHIDGSEHFFSPEVSIEAQSILGADMIIAFDECTYYPATKEYSRSAMERTHHWALRSLEAYKKVGRSYQALYGVIQGGVYQELREESAKYIVSLDFPGIAIGGVSVGESKKEMQSVLDWVVPFLPENKPRHLLGVGEIDDIFSLAERGMDSFDCVMPTRLGRMGHILSRPYKNGKDEVKYSYDITKSVFAENKERLSRDCECRVCQNYNKGYLNHLFRTNELLAYKLATYHNLYFTEKLIKEIRESIKQESFLDLKSEWIL